MGGGAISPPQITTTSNSNLVLNIGGAKGKYFCLQFTVARRHKNILFYHLVWIRGREKERESEKKINKKNE